MTSEKHDELRFPLPASDLASAEIPEGVDRRAFMMRGALIGAMTVITGCSTQNPEKAAAATPAAPPPDPSPNLSPDLDVVRESKGPVMTTLEEFYKVGPGPSSSHTIGPMRITYDFYMIASNEIPANRRVDFDTTVAAMALTAKEMNAKYKETSEGGLAVSVVLC